MEAQIQSSHASMVPPENDWPAVPQQPLKARPVDNGLTSINVEAPPLGDAPNSRDDGGLSMDDIAAAQALEDLRAGNEPLSLG